MTTSFTTSDEFDPQDEGFGAEADYPSAFGITFTPKISGIAIGVGGFLIAGYLFFSQVMPVLGELSELNKQKQEKQEQLNQLSSNELEQILARKQGELEEAKDLKGDVLQLFAQTQNLETLLLDVNNFANLSNIKMNSYVPTGDKEKVADDSFGTLAANNLQVQTYNLDIEGGFSQLQFFLQDLERLQPLLVVQNLNTSILEPPIYLLENNSLSVVQEPTLKTTLTLKAVFPDLQPAPEAPATEGEQPTEGQ
ncbi:type II and III secretion system protein [Cyanobacterium aponinum UTEX 3222]|uniref:type II and III secretion system protein n=1 Tax=Cyanobacterium aponinum TaxID=379064 RepID=UPI002B4C196D|nr:type II and III secretion system protein [Cyanobacterium aponinum]WRL36803.1 type II and III secretion system protein [Cyanobacterium aponinum UTEX 3221]WRL43130.1 type II and III secretion system protein [Cyanobacterium aponinum UTEX 3222]